jgi:hypothetical protein
LLPAPPKKTPTLLKKGSAELREAKGGFKAALAKQSAAIREARKKKPAAAVEEKERRLARRLAKERKATTKVESR